MKDRLVADKLQHPDWLSSLRIRNSELINCNINDNPVINKKLREVSVEEGLVIAEELFQILDQRGDGIGLAANQVGIDAAVAVVNVIKPLVLINPKIISKENPIDFYEGCLSYPGQGVSTQRYRDVIVQTAQEECGWYFSGAESLQDVRGQWEEQHKKDEQEKRILESICVQHEIDHLNGVTIFNRQVDNQPVQRETIKVGRNEKCPCGSEKKFKKCCM